MKMDDAYRRILLHALGDLAGAAQGLDAVPRSTFAESFADRGFDGSDEELASLVAFGARMAARELVARDVQVPDLLARLESERSRMQREARRRRYEWARDQLLAEGKKPTDDAIGGLLHLSEADPGRTIRRWREDGDVP